MEIIAAAITAFATITAVLIDRPHCACSQHADGQKRD